MAARYNQRQLISDGYEADKIDKGVKHLHTWVHAYKTDETRIPWQVIYQFQILLDAVAENIRAGHIPRNNRIRGLALRAAQECQTITIPQPDPRVIAPERIDSFQDPIVEPGPSA